MKIHDTLTGADVNLDATGRIGVYICGLTVYDDAHVGHARASIVFDVMRRHLEQSGAAVTFVQNFTDVDDKILERAASTNVKAAALAEKYIARYGEDAEALNIRKPTHEPRATAHMPEIIEMIQRLIESDSAYVAENGVYFDVSSFTDYGKLSGKKTDELMAGARVKVDASKRSPLDFALWKLDDGELTWQSPWGQGRPGWHIECSAMSAKHFESEIDIHGGGRDLIFPHHENEIAQSESCHDHKLARVWMHVGMVTVDGQKMSKSLGNSKTVRTAISEWGANALRVFCLGARYAKPIDYSESAMSESVALWQQIETCYYELRRARVVPMHGTSRLYAKFTESLDDNCDTRGALDALLEMASRLNDAAATGGLSAAHGVACSAFATMLNVMGLRVRRTSGDNEDALDALADKRESLRAEKKYDEADAVRDKMKSIGADVLDHDGRTVWVIRER